MTSTPASRPGAWISLVTIAAGIGIAVVGAPILAPLAVATLLAVAGVFLLPKTTLATVIVFLSVQPMMVNLVGGPQAGPALAIRRVDDLILVAAALRVAVMMALRAYRVPVRHWVLLAALFFCAGAIGGVLRHVPLRVLLVGSFFALKFPIAVLFCLSVPWSADDARRIRRWALWAAPLITLLALVIWMMPKSAEGVFTAPSDQTFETMMRGGHRVMIGPFGHPGVLAWALAVCSCFAVAVLLTGTGSRASAFIALGTALLGIFGSLRRKPLLGLPIAVMGGIVGGLPRRRQKLAALTTAFLLMAAVGIGARARIRLLVRDTELSYLNPGSEAAPRLLLYGTGVEIAGQEFPLGEGFGRFGGFASKLWYSPVYYRFGLQEVWGLSPSTPYYLMDAYWGHLLGEAGWLGTAAYLFFLALLWRRASVIAANSRDRDLRYIALAASMVLLEGIVESVATPIFEVTLDCLVIAIPLAMAVVLDSRLRRTDRPEPA